MSTIIYIIIAIVAIVMFCVFVLPTLFTQEKEEKPTQPDHFDLLDDNGDPIKEPKVKIVIEGGNSDAPIQELQYFCIKDKGYHVSVWPKNQGYQGMDYIRFDIAGITHGEHVDDHLGEFIANLIPEPTNPYDANAIKVVTGNGHRVGYVPKDMTQDVREFVENLPCQCYCYIGISDGTYFTDCYIKK
jgi:hypothetical protein